MKCVCEIPLPDDLTSDISVRDLGIQEYTCPCGREWLRATRIPAKFVRPGTWESVSMKPDGEWIQKRPDSDFRFRETYPAKDAEHVELEDLTPLPYTYMRLFRGIDPDDVDDRLAHAWEMYALERYTGIRIDL